VVFTPQSSGTASDAVSFVSNAGGSPAVENLGGSGIAPPQHSVALTWADAGTDVSGYNIYRSTAITSQGTQINSTLDPSPDYTDSTVLAGQTYYYVTTAVSTSGVESTPSNQVKAKIPTP
jgi:fibronectin type 3 domain-containing protein